jgi:hypothetical protein
MVHIWKSLFWTLILIAGRSRFLPSTTRLPGRWRDRWQVPLHHLAVDAHALPDVPILPMIWTLAISTASTC